MSVNSSIERIKCEYTRFIKKKKQNQITKNINIIIDNNYLNFKATIQGPFNIS